MAKTFLGRERFRRRRAVALTHLRRESVSARRTALRCRRRPLAGQVRDLAWRPEPSRAVTTRERRAPNGFASQLRQRNRLQESEALFSANERSE
jgi:hypothetical protein